MQNSGEWTFVILLLAVHWVPLLAAMLLWPLKGLKLSVASVITLLLSLVSWLVVFICIFIFTDVRSGGNMTGAAAYIIYGVMSLGIVPVVIIGAHILAGRFAGFAARRFSDKRGSQISYN